MKKIVGTINKIGIIEIADFLAKNHMRGENFFTQDMLKAWAHDAEISLEDGNGATIEIKSLDSINKVNQTFTISKSGIDWKEVNIEHKRKTL